MDAQTTNGTSYYHSVDRDWSQGGNSSQQHGATYSAMQRWQAESTRDQPYHGIQAVKVEKSLHGGDRRAQSGASSVGYLDPREKRA